MNIKTSKQRRIQRVRSKVRGAASRPRLSVHRSNQHLYVQIIDDLAGKTLVAVSDFELAEGQKGKRAKEQKSAGVSKVDIAGKIGELVAEKAKKKKISKVNFDRGPYAYHGRVKAVAEGARRGGLDF